MISYLVMKVKRRDLNKYAYCIKAPALFLLGYAGDISFITDEAPRLNTNLVLITVFYGDAMESL